MKENFVIIDESSSHEGSLLKDSNKDDGKNT